MSTGWVVDTSVGIGWVHFSQATPETQALLKAAQTGTRMVVPPIWFAEMANGLLLLKRRGKITIAEWRSCLAVIDSMKMEVDEDAILAAVHAASDVADAHGLTVYDATYLESALRLRLDLATRDQQLKAAAKACGVNTL